MKRSVVHKRCPFCGGAPRLKGGELSVPGTFIHWIDCRKCRVSQLAYNTPKQAWEKWDTRVKP